MLSILQHMEIAHGIVLTQTRGVDVGGWGPEKCVLSFPRVLNSVACPLDRCLTRANNPGSLREHFVYQNWKSKVAILQGGPEPLP